MKKELTLHDYLQLVQRRRWAILISTGGVVILTFLYLILKPPLYQSASTFMLESKELSFTERGMGFKEQTRPLGYYEAVMRSRIFRSRLQGALMADSLLQDMEEVNASDLNRAIREDIRLSTSEYSEFIELSARANDPVVAYRLASYATQILKDRCQEIDREELQNAVNFIDHQQNVSKAKLEEAERALQEFKKRTNITLTDADGGMMTELMEMEKRFTAVQTERELAQANLSAYRQRLAQVQGRESQTLSSSQDPEVARIRRQIADLQRQRDEAADTQGETDESVRLLDERIERVRRELINQMIQSSPGLGDMSGDGDALMWKNLQEKIIEAELNVFILENKEQYYQSVINEFRKNNPRLMEEAIEFMRMSRAQSVAENLYKFLLERGEEAKIKAATGTGGIRVIDDPVLPAKPVPANMARNLVLGLFLGLGLGFGVALVREFLDHTIQSREDITRLDGLSVMGMIPAFNGFSKNVLIRNGNGLRD
ncbi:MAG TPA: hypothetical protein ENN03_02085, partial [bacterium]|nr:hypothetical protein [bacterium]